MSGYPFLNWRLKQGSASAARTSGLLASAQAGQWWRDPLYCSRPYESWWVCEVGAFYWTALAPEIVNSGREEQGSASV
ncbi:MAG: hypothetical protein RLZZ206_2186 [Cyanobacteriota bacterium]|jgi:hypothetical protein